MEPLQKTEQRFPKKLKTKLPYDLAIQFLGIYPKKLKSGTLSYSLFTVAKTQEQVKSL